MYLWPQKFNMYIIGGVVLTATSSQNIYFRFTYILQESKNTIVKILRLYNIENEYSTRGKPYSRANKEEKTIFQTFHK